MSLGHLLVDRNHDCPSHIIALGEHPGGKRAIVSYAGKNATEQFYMMHRPDVIKKYGPEFLIGTVPGSAKL